MGDLGGSGGNEHTSVIHTDEADRETDFRTKCNPFAHRNGRVKIEMD